jgi:hypothetical protein
LHSCTRKRVLARTSCATTAFDVFVARDEFSAGIGTTEHDFGDTGLQDFVVYVNGDELAGTSFQVDVYTRETDTDGWWLIGGTGADAVSTSATFPFQRYRYVKVIITITGSSLPADVTGY